MPTAPPVDVPMIPNSHATSLLFCFFLLATSGNATGGGEWPQFRGPDGQGHTSAVGLPTEWSETQNIAWKTGLPGEGHSSPVISGEQIWLTTAVTETLPEAEQQKRLSNLKHPQGLKLAGSLSLQALQVNRTTGAIEQQIRLFGVSEPEPKHALNSYASPTPVIVDEFVYCHFGTYGTACIQRRTGTVVWKQNSLHCDHQNGPGSSPVAWQDLLILHYDGMDAQFIAALNRSDGSVRWKKQRSGEMHPQSHLKKAYATPLIIESADIPLVISPAADWVYGYHAGTGEEVWRAHYGRLGFSTVPRPVAEDGRVFISTSYMQPRLLAVDFTGRGDVTETHVRWTADKGVPRKPSMLVADGNLYTVTDNGIAACLNATDGSEVWKIRLRGEFSASPLFAQGCLYFFGQNGETTVIRAGAEPKEIARNTLNAGFMASPAVAEKALFLRTEEALYRVCRTIPTIR